MPRECYAEVRQCNWVPQLKTASYSWSKLAEELAVDGFQTD